MKALITGDIHVHKYRAFNQDNRRLKNIEGYIDLIFDHCIENNIRLILLTGDLYNLMQIVHNEVENTIIRALNRNFNQRPGGDRISIVAISGNHDFATKNLLGSPGVSALERLADIFQRFFIQDEGAGYFGEKVCLYGIPCYEFPEHFRERLAYWAADDPGDGVKKILLMHQTTGTKNPMIPQDILVTDPLFHSFDMVFNGHIHEGERIADNFINVGSPLHRDAGDVGVRKGFWTCDLNDPQSTATFVDITDKFPQFIYVEAGQPLTEWEQQQYVIPIVTPDNLPQDEVKIVSKFNNTLTKPEILQNFVEEVRPDDVEKLVPFILKYL